MPLHKSSLQGLGRPSLEPSSTSSLLSYRDLSGSLDSSDSDYASSRIGSFPSNAKPLSVVGQHCYPFFRDHLHNPYPTLQDKERIVQEAHHPDVTLLTVSNWFANSRRRSGWIDLCNEYFNGDTKCMVEICTHVISARGKSRNSDPPGIIDKILDMESKVRTWHEAPSNWALALYDLISDFTKELRLAMEDVIPTTKEYTSCSLVPPQNATVNATLGTKRTLTDYLSDTSSSLSRSPSVSSVSSFSTLSSENSPSRDFGDFENEERRPTKRGRLISQENPDNLVPYSPDLPTAQDQFYLSNEPLSRKRCFAELSDSNLSNLPVSHKRLRTAPNISEVAQVCQLNEQSPELPVSQILDDPSSILSMIPPTADLQFPDTVWNLDVGMYDWSSFPHLHLMVNSDSSNLQVNSELPTAEGNQDALDNPDDWLQSLFLVDNLDQRESLGSSNQVQHDLTGSIPGQAEASIAYQVLNKDASPNTTPQVLEDSQSIYPETPDRYESLGGLWDLPSGLLSESDNFPLDFPQVFLSDYSTP